MLDNTDVAEIETLIGEQDMLEQADVHLVWLSGSNAFPEQLAARLHARRQDLACSRVGDRRVNRARGRNLRLAQASARFATLALERTRIEIAADRVADEPVFYAITRIAHLHGRLVNQREVRTL